MENRSLFDIIHVLKREPISNEIKCRNSQSFFIFRTQNYQYNQSIQDVTHNQILWSYDSPEDQYMGKTIREHILPYTQN